MFLDIETGTMLGMSIVLLVVYLLVLLIFLSVLLFRKKNRWLRMIIISVICLFFNKTISEGIILPIHGAIRNVEYFSNVTTDRISDKEADGKWVPIYVMIEKFPGRNLLIAFAIGLLGFYSLKFIKDRVQAGKINLLALLITGALTIIFFKQTFQAAIINPIASLAPKTESGTGTSDSGNGLPETAVTYSYTYPLAYVLAALGFAILCYVVLDYASKRKSVFAPIDKTTASLRLVNGAILFTLVFSVFLVISVFVAIPVMNEINRPSSYTSAKLDTALSGIMNPKDTKDTFFLRLSTPKKSDAAPIPDSAFQPQYGKLNAFQQLSLTNQIHALNMEWNRVIRRRNEIVDRLNNYGVTNKSREATFKTGLLNSFDVAASNPAVNKAELYDFAINRFMSYRQAIRGSFATTDNDIALNDESNDNMISDIKTQLETNLRVMDSSNYQPVQYRAYFVPYFTSFDQVEGQMEGDYSLTGRNRNGSEWGFLGIMSGYLINTHSTELVLLIGMIGFGLLGASLLSFAPRDDKSNFIDSLSNQPLIKNFGGVLARGFGAALIVYLATKGGLALFTLSSAGSDPNGYILLLACFIGAVFSERVWTRISNSFAKDKDDGSKGNDASDKGQKPTEAPKPENENKPGKDSVPVKENTPVKEEQNSTEEVGSKEKGKLDEEPKSADDPAV